MSTDKTQIEFVESWAEYPYKELTQKIIGAAFEVHRVLGAGFLETVYRSALRKELLDRGINATIEAEVPVVYKSVAVGKFYADLLVEHCVICELKAVKRTIPEHEAQLLNYLRATGVKVGLLLNFGTPRLQIRRMIF